MSRRLPATAPVFAVLALALMISSAHAVPTNLAPSGTASASSVLGPCCGSGSFAPSLANNGNRAGPVNAIFHTNNSATPASFQIDLGVDKYLDRLEIYPRQDAAQGSVENFRIEVFDSSNALKFSDTYLPGQSTGDVPWGTTDIRNVFGSRVVLTRLDATPNFLTFAEFEVYGQDTPIGQNIALGKTATATSGGFGTVALDAIDGDISGNYSHIDTTGIGSTHPIFHSGTTGPSFWQVDLGQSDPFDYINLFSRTDFQGNGSAATLEVLADDGVTVLFSMPIQLLGTDLGGQRYSQTFNLPEVDGRFVRLSTTNSATGDNFLTFAEVEVFAAVLPEPTSLVLGGMAMMALGLRRRRTA